jgi:hypothetical protein
MVAFALRQPWYAGRIKDERNRLWLAAMIDTEGSIGINWQRGGEHRPNDVYSVSVKVHNTSKRLIERCAELAGVGSVAVAETRNRTVYAWSVYGAKAREVLREVYPYLVAKQHEARLAYSNDECISTQARKRYEALRLLHAGSETTVDAPPPPDCLEPGWYLRSDIIWNKPNPMPESVTDRPTKSHEYVFLLSKGPRYFFDADAIREDGAGRLDFGQMTSPARLDQGAPWNGGQKDEANGRNKRSVWTVATQPFPGAHFATFPPKLIEPCILAGCPERACGVCGAPWERIVERGQLVGTDRGGNYRGREAEADAAWQNRMASASAEFRPGMAYENRTLGFRPSCGHDAPAVPGTVLDPFAGAGTTGMVALRHNRSFVGLELSPEYVELARDRIIGDSPLLNTSAEAV